MSGSRPEKPTDITPEKNIDQAARKRAQEQVTLRDNILKANKRRAHSGQPFHANPLPPIHTPSVASPGNTPRTAAAQGNASALNASAMDAVMQRAIEEAQNLDIDDDGLDNTGLDAVLDMNDQQYNQYLQAQNEATPAAIQDAQSQDTQIDLSNLSPENMAAIGNATKNTSQQSATAILDMLSTVPNLTTLRSDYGAASEILHDSDLTLAEVMNNMKDLLQQHIKTAGKKDSNTKEYLEKPNHEHILGKVFVPGSNGDSGCALFYLNTEGKVQSTYVSSTLKQDPNGNNHLSVHQTDPTLNLEKMLQAQYPSENNKDNAVAAIHNRDLTTAKAALSTLVKGTTERPVANVARELVKHANPASEVTIGNLTSHNNIKQFAQSLTEGLSNMADRYKGIPTLGIGDKDEFSVTTHNKGRFFGSDYSDIKIPLAFDEKDMHPTDPAELRIRATPTENGDTLKFSVGGKLANGFGLNNVTKMNLIAEAQAVSIINHFTAGGKADDISNLKFAPPAEMYARLQLALQVQKKTLELAGDPKAKAVEAQMKDMNKQLDAVFSSSKKDQAALRAGKNLLKTMLDENKEFFKQEPPAAKAIQRETVPEPAAGQKANISGLDTKNDADPTSEMKITPSAAPDDENNRPRRP